jgi:hypothetical protein
MTNTVDIVIQAIHESELVQLPCGFYITSEKVSTSMKLGGRKCSSGCGRRRLKKSIAIVGRRIWTGIDGV